MLKRRVLMAVALSFSFGIACAYFLDRLFYIGYIISLVFVLKFVFFKREYIKRAAACALAIIIGVTYTTLFVNAGRVGDIEDAHITAKVRTCEGEGKYIVEDIVVNGNAIGGRARLSTYEPIEALPGQMIELNNASLYTPKGKDYPGGFDYRTYLLANGSKYAMYASKGIAFGEPNGMRLHFYNAKQRLSQNIDEVFLDNADIMKALVIGERSDITDKVYEDFRVSGTVHVLALSGLHVSALTMALFWLLDKIGVRHALQWLIIAPLMLIYCAVVGFSPSITRAVLMALLMYIAGLRMRRYDPLTSLSFAALVLLLINPLTLFDIGFILSFMSVLGIIAMSEKIGRLLSFMPKYIAQLAAVSISAQIAILPFQILYYGSVSLISVFANLIVVPLIGVMLAFGYAGTALSFILPKALAGFISAPGYMIASVVKPINSICASVPFGSVNLYDPWAIVTVLFYACLILFFCTKKYKISIACAAACIALFALEPLLGLNDALTWTAYSVGNADASLIRCGKHAIMIDTGEKDSQIYRSLRSEGIKPDAIFLSHAHDDHAGGVYDIVKNTGAKRIIIWQGMTADDVEKTAEESLNMAASYGAVIEKAAAGDVFEFGDIKVSVLAPYEKSGNGNRDSMVLLVENEDSSLLFMGDTDVYGELFVKSVDVDAIKIGHHGSNTSTSANFLSRLSPEYAIISAGRNSYGHPSDEVLERLDKAGVKTFVTRDLSSIRLVFSGGETKLFNYNGRRWSAFDLR